MNMDYHDFIWDLGGTLVDNYGSSTSAFMKTLNEFGITGASWEQIYLALKESRAKAIEQFVTDENQRAEFLESYKENEALALARPVFCSGAKELLDWVSQRGGRHFLISHRDNSTIELLTKLGVIDAFTEIITSERGFPRKPDPSSMLYLKEKYQIEHGLVLGDRLIDHQAAQAAGFDDFIVTENSSLMNLLEKLDGGK